MADVSVRPARPADAEHVAHLQLTTWRAAYPFLPPDALEVPLEQAAALWLHAIEAPPGPQHRVLVALDRDELVGFAASAPTAVPTTAELTSLVVLPSWGRRGHGARLLAATVDHWRTDSTSRAQHWVWEQDPATNAFLTSAGWAPDGATRELDVGTHTERQLRWHTDLRAP